MSQNPPLLPFETLRRVLRVARFDGGSVLGLSGLFSIISAVMGDYSGALIGLAIAGAGVFELHGVSLLNHGHSRGLRWLVGSQIYLLITVLAYVIWKLSGNGVEAWLKLFQEFMKTPELQMQLEASGQTPEEMMKSARTLYYLGFMMVGVLTFFYQGAMVLYITVGVTRLGKRWLKHSAKPDLCGGVEWVDPFAPVQICWET